MAGSILPVFADGKYFWQKGHERVGFLGVIHSRIVRNAICQRNQHFISETATLKGQTHGAERALVDMTWRSMPQK